MAHSVSILQANVNHCAAAQDLLMQTAVQWNIDVAIVAEPYVVRARDDWAGDKDNSVAVVAWRRVGPTPFRSIVRGPGWVSVFTGDLMVIGVYMAPNKSFADFERMLFEVGELVAVVHPTPVVLAGDFNAKSSAWGSPVTDLRGETLAEWAVSTGLVLLNRGAVHTCVRHRGGSIVDLSFATPTLARRTRRWRVEEGVETLSDHRYVRYDIVSTLADAPPVGLDRPLPGEGPRWRLATLNVDVAKEAAVVERWAASGGTGGLDADARCERLVGALTRVCDAAMRRAGPVLKRTGVYWWRPHLAELRTTCQVARRKCTRSRRRSRRDPEQEEALLVAYRAARAALTSAIKAAKEEAWREWLESLDQDPWGRPYKVVSQKLRPWAPPLTRTLDPLLATEVVGSLFPMREPWDPPRMAAVEEERSAAPGEVAPPVSEAELDAAVLKLRLKSRAPGPDGVPGRVLACVAPIWREEILALMSECMASGRVPRRWKSGKLVLIRKHGRPADSPSAYRPIVLLDEACKLFERVVAARLADHMGTVGPDLSESQFGFRRGRSTIDAIARLRDRVEEAVGRGEVLLAVSLDIANAFNTIPWTTIAEALRYHRVPWYLRRVLQDYFVDRAIIYPARDRVVHRNVWCGVPQGSVLGPILWNIGFDWVLRGANLRGVGVLCYADDTLVTARGRSFREAGVLATAGTAHVVSRIRALGLRVALEKSQAIFFHGPGPGTRPPRDYSIVVGGTPIPVGGTLKYLGLVLDGRWRFGEHFRVLAPKLTSYAGMLAKLLPNIGGAGGVCRRLFDGVVRSKALYGAPIWAAEAPSAEIMALLRRSQRTMAQRASRAYRTVSGEAACLIAGSAPWDLEARVLAEVYWRRARERLRGEEPLAEVITHWRREAREDLFSRWEERLADAPASRRLVGAIRPVLREWVEARHREPTYHLTQLLTGHGCFGRYLWKVVGILSDPGCLFCGPSVSGVCGVSSESSAEDSAEHTLTECRAWAQQRATLVGVIGRDLSLPAVVLKMAGIRESWAAVASFAHEVMAAKREALRERERGGETLPPRRTPARGRRHALYAAALPD